MTDEADARTTVQAHLGSEDFEFEEFPEGWLVVRTVPEGWRGAATFAVERATGNLLRFPSSIPPDRVMEEFAALRSFGRPVESAPE